MPVIEDIVSPMRHADKTEQRFSGSSGHRQRQRKGRHNRYFRILMAYFARTALPCAALAGFATEATKPVLAAPVAVPKSKDSKQQPLTYLADHESYEKSGLIVWKGNVRVWQGQQALRADEITYDRASGVVEATGHVALVYADGSTTFAEHLEFSHGLQDGIGLGIYMRMRDNAKIASAGMRRSSGLLNSFSHAVYTACITCAKNPDAPPFWQFQAYDATQDKEHQNIEFSHAWLKILGLPVFYFPYFSISDPTVKRHSGFLTFNLNPHDQYLGTYMTLPYYWAIDDQQDITFIPLIATSTGPQLSAEYRRAFNAGNIRITGGVADDTRHNERYTNAFGVPSHGGNQHGAQGYLFAHGDFALNRHWRIGTDINVASSANYMRDYRIPGWGSDSLNSTGFIEGYGVGSYLRFDGQGYQGLNNGIINDSQLPLVLPRLTYDFQGEPDALGGTLKLHTTNFNVYRSGGTRDQRGEFALQWDRPFTNALGQKWVFTGRLDTMLYHATHLETQPVYNTSGKGTQGQALPTFAAKMSWPFLRSFAKGHGTHVLEPIVQLIAAPTISNRRESQLPNEDSLAYELSDTTLFALNRYTGTDRLDNGMRANVGIHQNWTWNGHSVDMLIGESFQQHRNYNIVQATGSTHHITDPVARVTITPNQYLDLTTRGRYNPYRKQLDYGESLLSTGIPHLRLTGGYVYAPVTPYYYYYTNYRVSGPNQPYLTRMSEISGNISTYWGPYHFSAYSRRSLSTKRFVSNGGDIGYENDCFGMDVQYIRQYTYIGGQRRYSTVLFNFFFKTIGTFGVNG